MTKADANPDQQPAEVMPDDTPGEEGPPPAKDALHAQPDGDSSSDPTPLDEGAAAPADPPRPERALLRGRLMTQEPAVALTSGGSTTIYLSLFLILLTFFIGLTSNAQFDMARVGMVFDSVAASFGAHGRADRRPGSGERIGGLVWFSDDYATAADPAFARAFRSAFKPLIPEGASFVENSDGRVFVDVPESALFIEGTWAVRQSRMGLLETLGRLLAPSVDGDGVDADGMDDDGADDDGRRIAISTATDRVGGLSGQGELDVRRAAALARWMEQSGAPAAHLSTGVDGGSRTKVRFEIFRARRRAS